MPLTKVKQGNQTCWRWGNKGKIYCGKDGKSKALKQGYAENNGDEAAFRSELAKGGLEKDTDVVQFLEQQEKDRYLLSAQAYVSQKERDKMSDSDFGWPEEKKYPVADQKHLDAAVKLIGRAPADKQASIKSRLKQIAKRKGLKLPESWS